MICIRKIENVTTSVSLVSGKCVCIYIEVCVARPSCVRVLSLQESTGGCENVCVCVCVCVCVWYRCACAVLQVSEDPSRDVGHY